MVLNQTYIIDEFLKILSYLSIDIYLLAKV